MLRQRIGAWSKSAASRGIDAACTAIGRRIGATRAAVSGSTTAGPAISSRKVRAGRNQLRRRDRDVSA
jgi:hypothetical protein